MVPRFFPGNSTTTFCDSIKFVSVSKNLLGKIRKKAVADGRDAWFAYLNAAHVSAIRLSRMPQNNPKMSERMAAAFIGGAGTWALEAVQQNGRRAIWLSRWEVWNQNAPERRIWRVSYGRVSERRSSTTPVANAVLEFVKQREISVEDSTIGLGERASRSHWNRLPEQIADLRAFHWVLARGSPTRRATPSVK